MNHKVSMFFAAGLLVCSMPSLAAPPAPPKAPASAASRLSTAPRPPRPNDFRSVPLQQPPVARDSKGLPPPRFCHLGEDCLALVPHPFELCQVSSKRCSDKLAEVLQVERPVDTSPPAPAVIKTTR